MTIITLALIVLLGWYAFVAADAISVYRSLKNRSVDTGELK